MQIFNEPGFRFTEPIGELTGRERANGPRGTFTSDAGTGDFSISRVRLNPRGLRQLRGRYTGDVLTPFGDPLFTFNATIDRQGNIEYTNLQQVEAQATAGPLGLASGTSGKVNITFSNADTVYMIGHPDDQEPCGGCDCSAPVVDEGSALGTVPDDFSLESFSSGHLLGFKCVTPP